MGPLSTHDRAIWYRLLPDSAGRCRLLTTTLVSPAAREDPDYESALVSEAEMLRTFHYLQRPAVSGSSRYQIARS